MARFEQITNWHFSGIDKTSGCYLFFIPRNERGRYAPGCVGPLKMGVGIESFGSKLYPLAGICTGGINLQQKLGTHTPSGFSDFFFLPPDSKRFPQDDSSSPAERVWQLRYAARKCD